MERLCQALKRWAQKTHPFGGVLVYGWRHDLMCKVSKRYSREYDAALDAAIRNMFDGCNISLMKAGTVDASQITVR